MRFTNPNRTATMIFEEVRITRISFTLPGSALYMIERELKRQMILGIVIALFGILCPLFWKSLLSGNAPFETWVYGIHSAFFVVFGAALVGKGWYDLKRRLPLAESPRSDSKPKF